MSEPNTGPLDAALDRSLQRLASKIGLAATEGSPENAAQENHVSAKTKIAETESPRGSQNQTMQDRGDYGTQSEAVGAQKKETRDAAPEGTDQGGAQNMTAKYDDKNYTLNGPAKLAVRAAIEMAISGKVAEAAALLQKVGADGPTDQNLGDPVGGKPDSVEEGEEEAEGGGAAETAEIPAGGATGADSMVAAEIQRKLNELSEQKQVTNEVMQQLQDVLQSIGMGKGAARRKLIAMLNHARAIAKVKQAGPAADKKSPPKVVTKNVPPSSQKDDGEDRYDLSDGDPDESMRGQANQETKKEDTTHDGAEHLDRGDYKLGAIDFNLYDSIPAAGAKKAEKKPAPKKAEVKKTASVEFGLMDVCLPDYFSGSSHPYLQVIVRAGDSDEDIVDAIVDEARTGYVSNLDEEKSLGSDEEVRKAATDAVKQAGGAKSITRYIEEVPEGEEVDSEVYAYFAIDLGDDESDEEDSMETEAAKKTTVTKDAILRAKAKRLAAKRLADRRKKTSDTESPKDKSEALGDADNTYESALQGDTADDEISDGNRETLESPETGKIADEAASQLDREHAVWTRGTTVAGLVPPAKRAGIEKRLAAFEATNGRLREAARALVRLASNAKAPAITSTKMIVGRFSQAENAIKQALSQKLPPGRPARVEAARKFASLVESTASLVEMGRHHIAMLDTIANVEKVAVAKLSRVQPAFKLALQQYRWGQIDESKLVERVAAYVKMNPESFSDAIKTAQTIGDVSRRSPAPQGNVRTARRLPNVLSGVQQAPRDELEGIFDGV